MGGPEVLGSCGLGPQAVRGQISRVRPHCPTALHRKRCTVHTSPDRSTCWTSSVSVGDGPGQLSGARVVGRGGLHRLAGLEDSFVLVSQTLNHACIRASGAISSFGSVRVHSLKGVPWTVRPGPCSGSMLSLETCCRRFDGRRGTKPGHTGYVPGSVPGGTLASSSRLCRPPLSSTWPVRWRQSFARSSAAPKAAGCRHPATERTLLSRDDRPGSDG